MQWRAKVVIVLLGSASIIDDAAAHDTPELA
jgi:hypothetical protein